ncbi:winged helix-turn-helix domain-containing protein [Terriglobus roseus]|uniref:DNA-binding winged helix-turn-helix (WHTH) domain-containing protein n=1 Tax=Terriglobus roseus TaxID=392734 RepID=A0A1G7HLA2_9BACT|nr:winged helix-turn-helix domain-containing protein [Terriglobus roseus]SDF01044.1 DNA-binding winged helix-turn-helix (wHTH) domain-containing protein [Terriglobus roseus]
MPTSQSQRALRFGLFELDLQARELYRSGIRIHLAPQPFDLLQALTEVPGTVVSREDLQHRLWPPNIHVDYDHGLNKAVRKLREALGDSAELPRYIETVQGVGYRFIAPVTSPTSSLRETEHLSETVLTVREPVPIQSVSERRLGWTVFATLGTGLVLAVIAIGAVSLRLHALRRAQGTLAPGVHSQAEAAYLHGRYLWFGEKPLASSDYFKRAITLQPDYAPAWAGMSLFYGAALVRGRLDPAEGLGLQEEAASRSLTLAPSLPEAHLASCGSIFLKTWQFEEANIECKRALQLDPNNAEVYHFQSKMLAAVNRPQDALSLQKVSTRLDPLSRPWALGQALLQARRYNEALSETRARLESFPHDSALLYLIADIYRERGNAAESEEFLEQSYRESGDEVSATQIHRAFRAGGNKAVLQWDLDRMLNHNVDAYVSPAQLGLAYARLGDQERALSMLQRALEQHAPDLLWIRWRPVFDTFASDARFQRILQQLPATERFP